MDKFNLTPKTSNIESLMEKFRLEFGNAVEEDRSHNRRITISPFKFDSNEACNIDSQIKELEDVIAKLQNEITDINRSADCEYVPDLQTESKKSYVIETKKDIAEAESSVDDYSHTEEKEDTTDITDTSDGEQCNQIFPLLIRNINLPINPDKKPIRTVVSELLTVEAESSSDEAQINAVKREVLSLWNDLQDYTPKDNLDELIYELQAEISEHLDSLKDVNIDEDCDLPKSE